MEQENKKNKGDVVTLCFSKMQDIGAKPIELTFYEYDSLETVKFELAATLNSHFSQVQIVSSGKLITGDRISIFNHQLEQKQLYVAIVSRTERK